MTSPASAAVPGEAPVEFEADLLNGLGELADLLGNASETINQCLLTLEDKLSASPIAREEWIPIQAGRSFVERVIRVVGAQTSEERIFGGVAVTIMKMGQVAQDGETQQCGWQYELGYALAGEDWVFMIRTASIEPSNDEGEARFSNLGLLREAPLEIRLKAIREIPNLIKRLEGTGETDESQQCAQGGDCASGEATGECVEPTEEATVLAEHEPVEGSVDESLELVAELAAEQVAEQLSADQLIARQVEEAASEPFVEQAAS